MKFLVKCLHFGVPFCIFVALLGSLLFRRYYLPNYFILRSYIGLCGAFLLLKGDVGSLSDRSGFYLRIPPPTYLNELVCVKCGLCKSPHVSAFSLTHMQILLQNFFYMNFYSNIIIHLTLFQCLFSSHFFFPSLLFM